MAMLLYARQCQAGKHSRQADKNRDHTRKDDTLGVHWAGLNVAFHECVVGVGHEVVAGDGGDRAGAPSGGSLEDVENGSRAFVAGWRTFVVAVVDIEGKSAWETRKAE